MHINIFSPDSKLSLNEHNAPSKESDLVNIRSELAGTWGAMTSNTYWFSNFCLIVSEFDLNNDTVFSIEMDDFAWQTSFVIEGGLTVISQTAALKWQCNRADGNYNRTFNAKASIAHNTKIFSIVVTKQSVARLWGDGINLSAQQYDKQMFTLVEKDSSLSNKINILLEYLTSNDHAPNLKRAISEEKVLEIMAMKLHFNLNVADKSAAFKLTREDIAKLYQARQLVESNIKTPFSILALSKKIGLNDFKLKKGFKEYFGNTVFGYLNNIRMETAYKLLSNGKSVTEVATTVGYKNPHHFAAAFKKSYQVSPSKIRM
ncbi:helix-turn-helix transcriptional regulator [Mucilaginibacter sp. JRF]|uniref:AraC family transcriptional regulator n=1 Tax=Mucilaginibacter sp. JRF TaxID=2780088 RepID=UPI00187F28B3|nr:AraC family transcriptional regulator [Mucilaginibacter sp. JRF]MBE9586624.1 helix-turn-helix transcriptional regulator [Mucilaginibacter sp. JRF]